MLRVNPQIRVINTAREADWDRLAACSPAMILMNHTSFFDFFLFTALLPPRFVRRAHVRTVMSASIAQLPFLGRSIGDHAGSFKVYFQAKGAGFGKGDASDFSVDRARQEAETARMEAHIKRRGVLAFCPEGGMNKTPSEGLNPFRRGSFAQAAKYSTPIWGAALHGSTAAWPRDALLGGDPSTVALSLEQLTLLPPPVATATAADLAEACQEAMQRQVDRLATLARGGARTEGGATRARAS